MSTPPASDPNPSSNPPPPPAVVSWSVQQVAEHLQSAEPPLLLDVREDYELRLARLTGALHMPLSEMHRRWPDIPRDRTVVVFCHHGVRSYNVVAQLAQAGFTNLVNMVGGIDAWSRAVDPGVPRY